MQGLAGECAHEEGSWPDDGGFVSVKCISWVYDQTVGDHIAKALLAKIADNANDQGVAWPSIRTLAAQTEIPERTIKRKLAFLIDAGWMTVLRERNEGRYGGNMYHLAVPWATVASGTEGHGGQHQGPLHARTRAHSSLKTTEPSKTEPSKELALAPPRALERDGLWDALTALFGEAGTRSARTLRGKIVTSLLEAGATPDLVAASPALYAERMPEGTTFTETALEKHWGRLMVPAENSNGRAHRRRYGTGLTTREILDSAQ